jgi:hypothetical protein
VLQVLQGLGLRSDRLGLLDQQAAGPLPVLDAPAELARAQQQDQYRHRQHPADPGQPGGGGEPGGLGEGREPARRRGGARALRHLGEQNPAEPEGRREDSQKGGEDAGQPAAAAQVALLPLQGLQLSGQGGLRLGAGRVGPGLFPEQAAQPRAVGGGLLPQGREGLQGRMPRGPKATSSSNAAALSPPSA